MTPTELVNVVDGLNWVSGRLRELPEDRDDAMFASLSCSLASLVVAELAKQLFDGVEPYEALRRAAVGAMAAPESDVTTWKILAARPKK